MKRIRLCAELLALGSLFVTPAAAGIITNVVETGGDNEATDTITAKWTGQTFAVTQANEPIPGAVVGDNYTVGVFGTLAPTFVDRNHRYSDDTTISKTIPAYLVGGEYIMSGNDNRDNASYKLDVTISSPANVYMLIDNRLSDTSAATPPTFDPTHMQWILDQGWIPTNNGFNRTASTAVPDEVAIDEGADNTINNWFSVYKKSFAPGVFSLLQANNDGQNMYGVVLTIAAQPGDVDLDADVDMTDFGFIRDNFQKSATSRAQGDLNGDNKVDFLDYRQWKSNFPFPIGPSLELVPEPATALMSLLAAAALSAAARSRRQSTRTA